jgi:hypothetical protein
MDGLDICYMANLPENDYLGGSAMTSPVAGISSLSVVPRSLNPPRCYSSARY